MHEKKTVEETQRHSVVIAPKKPIVKLGNHCALKLEKATKVLFTGFFSCYLSPNVSHGQGCIKTQAYGIKI